MNFARPVFLARVYKSSVCWDPLQTLGVQREQSESFLYYRAETAPGLCIPQQFAEGTERSIARLPNSQFPADPIAERVPDAWVAPNISVHGWWAPVFQVLTNRVQCADRYTYMSR